MRRTLVVVLSAGLVAGLAPNGNAYPRPGRTIRVSPDTDVNGNGAGGGFPEVSGNGRFVLFTTSAPLVEGDANGASDCYVRDLDTGEILRASLTHDGRDPNGACSAPAISADGRTVSWQSTATNLVPGDTNGFADVFVRDLTEGTTTRVSVSSAGAQGGAASSAPSISNDGTVVAFLSSATNLVPNDTNGFNDIFVRDLGAGTTERVSVASDGSEGVTAIANFALAGNGQHVVFIHRMPWGGDRSSFDDVFVHDRVTKRTELASLATDGSQPNGNSFYPSISDDGRLVAFGSFGTNLVPNDFNGAADAFVRDRQTGVTERVSVTSQGVEANHVVGIPVISGNGRYVTGNHLPTNYGYDDTNANTDVYVYDRVTGAIELASGTPEGTHTGNGISFSPTISDDGRKVAFYSDASDLIAGEEGGGHAYLRDLGPELGTGGLSASDAEGGSAAVSGYARFPGAGLASVADPAADGKAAAGAELTGVSLTYRPEEEDVLVEMSLGTRTHAWLPLVGTSARKPGALTYAVDLTLGGVLHRIQAVQKPDLTGAAFSFLRCAPACAEVAPATGGDGTLGDSVVISVPVGLLGGPGSSLGLLTAWVGLGDLGPAQAIDEASLSRSVAIPVPSVTLGSAPAGASAQDVVFDTPAGTERGRFSGVVPGGANREAWARVCLGAECVADVVAIA